MKPNIKQLKTGDLVKAIAQAAVEDYIYRAKYKHVSSIDDLANELNERFAAFDHTYFEDVRQMTNSELKDRGT